MKKLIISLLLTGAIVISVHAAEKKDTAVIETPSGQKLEVRVPKEAVKEVTKTGPNTYDVKIDRSEMKKIEIAPVPNK